MAVQETRDLHAQAASVQANGALALHAERDMDIAAGENTHAIDDASHARTKGFLSSRETTGRSTTEETTSAGSSLGGDTATDYTGTSSEHALRSTNLGAALGHDPGKGFNARRTDMDALQASALQRSRLVGGNVRIEATGGERPEDRGGTLTLAGKRQLHHRVRLQQARRLQRN